jgi:hypothetical protein
VQIQRDVILKCVGKYLIIIFEGQHQALNMKVCKSVNNVKWLYWIWNEEFYPSVFLPPLWRRGAYCFASVDQLVGRPHAVHSISWEPFTSMIVMMWVGDKYRRTTFDYRSKGQGSIYTGHKIMSTKYLENPFFDRHKTWYTGTSERVDLRLKSEILNHLC